jgi:hypothetical protein
MTDDDAGDRDQEVVFELTEWGDEFRAAVAKVLDERGVAHDWEGTDLVVDEEDADLVDAILDELEATPLEDVVELDDAPPPAANEATYDDISALYLAADRLVHAPDDPDVDAAFREAAERVAGTSAPYGVGDREWTRILAAIDDDTARALRDLLRPYV